MAKARLQEQISGEVIDMDFMAEYKHWLESGALSAEEHAELQSVADDKEEIESRFYAPLSFGTAGLRGVLGVVLNRMNRFTVDVEIHDAQIHFFQVHAIPLSHIRRAETSQPVDSSEIQQTVLGIRSI